MQEPDRRRGVQRTMRCVALILVVFMVGCQRVEIEPRGELAVTPETQAGLQAVEMAYGSYAARGGSDDGDSGWNVAQYSHHQQTLWGN